MEQIITSASNKIIMQLRALHTKKERDTKGLFVIEGEKFTDEIADDWEIQYFLLSESFAAKNVIEKYKESEIYIAADHAFKAACDTVNPQGVLAVVKQKEFLLREVLKKENPLIILLEETNDPGNLGAILRVADAAGADGIILSHGCADIYNPKVLRSAAGSVFHLPFVKNAALHEVAAQLKNKNISIYAAHLEGAALPYGLDLKKGCAFLIGNEARGLSDNLTALSDARVKIPIIGRAESLNASVACGILLYEAVRQRITFNALDIS